MRSYRGPERYLQLTNEIGHLLGFKHGLIELMPRGLCIFVWSKLKVDRRGCVSLLDNHHACSPRQTHRFE